MTAEPLNVYTCSDLKNWSAVGGALNPPARLAVFGDPVAHSLSPQMFDPALRAAGIDSSYVRVQVRPDELGEALAELPRQDFTGVNLTVPHKAAALPHMAEVTEVARKIGAVNTVVVEDGHLIGHNSDGPGFQMAIREAFSVDLSDLRILVLGAGGGAGRAAAVQSALDRCERLVLVNRTVEKARTLAAGLTEYFREDRLVGPVGRLEVVPWEEDALRHHLNYVDLIVNATPLGMKRTDPPLLSGALIQPHHIVYDMVYSPPRTRLLADAESAGARGCNGLSMLLWQGAASFDFWFNRQAPLAAMREGLANAMQK